MGRQGQFAGRAASVPASDWAVAVPRPARGADVFPKGSTKWILLHLIREVRDPDWSAAGAAHRLMAWADGDLDVLQAARVRLVLIEPGGSRPSDIHERARDSLDLAIRELCMSLARSVEPGDGGSGG